MINVGILAWHDFKHYNLLFHKNKCVMCGMEL